MGFFPGCRYFKPAGVPLRTLQEVELTPDEVEALRLADFEGNYQEEAAAKMNISRPTFSRTVEIARKKVADALVNGKSIRLEGQEQMMPEPTPGTGGWGRGGRGRGRHGRRGR